MLILTGIVTKNKHMISATNITNLITLAVVGSIFFSVLHAKDVSAATAVLNPTFSTNVQSSRGFENAIHLEFHTHVDRQQLSSILQNIQQDKPLTSVRTLKKNHNIFEKKQAKLHDGMLGYHLPQLA